MIIGIVTFFIGMGLVYFYNRTKEVKKEDMLIELRNSVEYKSELEKMYQSGITIGKEIIDEELKNIHENKLEVYGKNEFLKGLDEGKKRFIETNEYKLSLESQFIKGLEEGEIRENKKLKAKFEEELKIYGENEFLKGIVEGKKRFIETKEYEVILENQFRKGIKEGEEITIKKITIEYTPYIEVKDKMFSKTAKSGYSMQLYFSGLPIGDAIIRIIKTEEKFKEENMKYIVENINNVLTNIMATIDPLGIPTRVNKPKVENAKK